MRHHETIVAWIQLVVSTLLCGTIGLLRAQLWARSVMIGISVMELPIFPLGTAVGAYSLWALTSR
jgi:hypothetical protein